MSAGFSFTRESIDLRPLVEAVRTDADGAVATFLGTVRNEGHGKRVVRLEYESYEPMARAEMERVFSETRERFRIGEFRVVHRLGVVPLGEASIAIAVAAAHREDAFAACKHLIDRIKKSVPIWKKEVYEDGSEWVGDRS